MKRIQMRMSEEVLTELSHERRQASFRGWDELFRSMLKKWRQPAEQIREPPSSCPASTQVEDFQQRMGRSEAKQERLLTLAESQEQSLLAIQQEMAELAEANRRQANLLGRAMNEQTERPLSGVDRISPSTSLGTPRRRLPT